MIVSKQIVEMLASVGFATCSVSPEGTGPVGEQLEEVGDAHLAVAVDVTGV